MVPERYPGSNWLTGSQHQVNATLHARSSRSHRSSRTFSSPVAALQGHGEQASLSEGRAAATACLFLDRSSVEVYVNDSICLTERIYPSRPDSVGVSAFAEGGDASLVSLDAWRMGVVWD